MAGQTAELRMHHALIIGSRVLAGLVGLIAFYFAFFLFEDEEGGWQNRLENLWIAVSDRAKITNSTSVALVNKIGDVLRRMFTQLFGDHMLSFQAVAVSTNLSLAGATLTTCLLGILAMRRGEQPDFSILWGIVVALSLIFFAIVPTYVKGWWAVATSCVSPICFFVAFRNLIHRQVGFIAADYVNKIVLVLLVLSVIADLLAVVALRRLFSALSKSVSAPRMLLTIVVLMTVALVVAASPAIVFVWLRGDLWLDDLRNLILLLWQLDATTLMACILPIGMLVVVLIHKLLWPLLSRVIYPLTRYKVLSNRKVLIPVGTLCLTFALHLESVGAKELLKLFV